MKFLKTVCCLVSAFALSSIGFSQGGPDCVNAQFVMGLGPHSLNLIGSSPSGDTPLACPNMGTDKDVWLEWIAPTTGLYSAEVCGDTVVGYGLAVWDTCGGNALSCAEFNCQYQDNRVLFQAVMGTTYKVQITSLALTGAIATLHFNEVQLADNDDCSNATVLAEYGSFAFDLADATTDGSTETDCFNVTNGVWFRWTSPYNRPVTLTLSEFFVHLSIVDGCTGQEIECNNGTGLLFRPTLNLDAQRGTEYLIRVASTSGQFRPAGFLSIQPNDVVIDPSTGRAYSLIHAEHTFQSAQAYAQSYRYRGVPGHLVTLNSQAEEDFVAASFRLPGFTRIGLYQDLNDPNYSEPAGAWKWVTNEPLNYTNWLGPNRPDNSFGQEHWGFIVAGQWEDAVDQAFAQLIEWPLDPDGTAFCEPAEPNSIGLSTQMYVEKSFLAPALVRLEAADGPPNQFGYFLVGTAPMDPGVIAGNGRLCLDTSGGNLVGRYNASGTGRDSIGIFDEFGALENLVNTSSAGTGYDLSLELPIAGGGLISPGQTWYFQLTHREPGGAFNFSNGVSVTF